MAKATRRKPAQRAEPVSRRVEVPGVRPATLKLVEIGPGSYSLFRSSRKLGTARVEEDGSWSARFEDGGAWSARAGDAPALLDLVGRYLLLGEARTAAALPLEKTDPALQAKGPRSAEDKLALKLLRQAQARRLRALDTELAAIRKTLRRR